MAETTSQPTASAPEGPKWSKGKVIAIVLGVLVVLGMISNLLGGDDETPTADPGASQSPEELAEPELSEEPTDPVTDESTPEAEPSTSDEPTEPASVDPVVAGIDPEAVEAALKETFMVEESWQETCASVPDGWSCYIADISAQSDDVLLVVLQISERDEELGDQAGRAIFGLVGEQFPEIRWVQVNNATNDVIGNVSRNDIPLLNR